MSSDKEFEEWIRKQCNRDKYDLCYDSKDMNIIRSYYERNKEGMKEAWDHQQSKLDAKDELLKEAIQCLKYYNYPDIDETGRGIVKSGCVANDFLNKPEIKQLRGEG